MKEKKLPESLSIPFHATLPLIYYVPESASFSSTPELFHLPQEFCTFYLESLPQVLLMTGMSSSFRFQSTCWLLPWLPNAGSSPSPPSQQSVDLLLALYMSLTKLEISQGYNSCLCCSVSYPYNNNVKIFLIHSYLNHFIYHRVVLIYLIDKWETWGPENLKELLRVTQTAGAELHLIPGFLMSPLLLLSPYCLECSITIPPF